MKYLNTKYAVFINETIIYTDILESMRVFKDGLLETIKAEQALFETEFSYSLNIENINDLEQLVNDQTFIKSLEKKNLRISKVEDTNDYDTFMGNDMKFVPIYKIDESDLANPIYIIIEIDKDIKLYKINDNFRKFYDSLTTKTLEIIYNDDSYIYYTTNSGNEWTLRNIERENDIFKKYFRKDELLSLLKSDKKFKINII